MSTIKCNTFRHISGSADNITLDASQNVTVEGNLTVDGTTTFSGTLEIPDDTVDIADLSATGTASSSTFLRGDNAWAAPTAGAFVKLNTFETTASDNVQACNVDGHFTSAYDTYLLIANVSPDDANSDFSYRMMSGGSVVTASEYVGSSFRSYNDTSDNNQLAAGSGSNPSAGDYNNPEDGMYPHADDMVDGDLTKTSTLELWIYNPLSTSEWGRFKSQFLFHASSNIQMMYQHGALQNTAALSGVSLYMENSSTDIVCKGALYGLTI